MRHGARRSSGEIMRKVHGGKVRENEHWLRVNQLMNPKEYKDTELQAKAEKKAADKKKRRAKRKATGR